VRSSRLGSSAGRRGVAPERRELGALTERALRVRPLADQPIYFVPVMPVMNTRGIHCRAENSGTTNGDVTLLPSVGKPMTMRRMAEVPAPRRRFGGAVAVGAGILLSRLSGLVRALVFTHYIG